MKRFVYCDGCGKKIYDGDRCVEEEGIIYICCSYSCLAKIRLNCRTRIVNDELLEDHSWEWETEES